MAARLVWPQKKFFEGYKSALLELVCKNYRPDWLRDELEDFPATVLAAKRRERLAAGCPIRTYWLVDGNEYIGMVQLRIKASARYPNIASHLYYEIRPCKRGRGYGLQAAMLLAAKAKSLNMGELIISCDEDNIRSKAIIEKIGGRLDRLERVPDRQKPVLMFRLLIS